MPCQGVSVPVQEYPVAPISHATVASAAQVDVIVGDVVGVPQQYVMPPLATAVPSLQASDASGDAPLGQEYPVVPAVGHDTVASAAQAGTVVAGVPQQYVMPPPAAGVPVLQSSDASGLTALGQEYPVVPAVGHDTVASAAHATTVVAGAPQQ